MLNVLLPILFSLTSIDPVKVHVYENKQKIEDRNVTFGVKETVEEILSNQGYTPVADTADGMDVWVGIDSIYSPQQIINIFGLKWLRKDYVVETSICIGSGCFKGKGIRRTYIFAAFLDVENNEVPLNRKSFSKALEASLRETAKFENKKQ
jgi:hypothetical protein